MAELTLNVARNILDAALAIGIDKTERDRAAVGRDFASSQGLGFDLHGNAPAALSLYIPDYIAITPASSPAAVRSGRGGLTPDIVICIQI